MSLNLPSLLGNIEQQFGSLPAIRQWEEGDKTLNWKELIGEVSSIGGVFKQLGLRPNDRYAILGKNSVTLASLLYAGFWTGCVPVPLNYRLSKFEIEHLLRDFSPKVIFTCEDFLHLVDADTANGLNAKLVAFDP
ncbi:MAG: AMP-binding protein, partial [Burkholderiaceae bacterium]